MKILLVSSEVAPFSKTGGLADVAGSLPTALRKLARVDARVVSPLYRMAKTSGFKIEKIKEVKGVPGFKDLAPFDLLQSKINSTTFYFIGKDEYYDRDGLYGTSQTDHPDNPQRFSFLCRAALAAMTDVEFYPDIIHTNDWETALIPVYRNIALSENHPLKKSKVLFSVHNLAYQGLFPREKTSDIGLTDQALDSITQWGKVSFIKSGIVFSDAINTVSKKYAKEILTQEFGCGLEGLLKNRKNDLYGILNGADYSDWNPETDKLIPVNYDARTLEKKAVCKSKLMSEMGLDLPVTAPLIGSVGRLTEQKGVDIITDSIDEILNAGAGLILLGKGEERYESVLKRVAAEKAGKVGISIDFNNRLAHMIEAGVDMFIMPSRYEPCGLNQMYSLKYGTIPVVRATGGLDDTIIDYSSDPESGNGFKFEKADAGDFIDTVKRAIKSFGNKDEWSRLQRRGMELDFSWKRSAREYVSLYKKVAG
ncbi:MAG: glycogen synthase GlgA [Candidatus Omnitrophica bacterium]|nr:glycogen synthase GlgA [Candidatus Omnitrophota bacterium]